MSRIGREPIAIPKGVEINLDGNTIQVKGPKGQLAKELHSAINVAVQGEEVLITRPSDEKEHRSLHGLTRTLVSNMVEGVTKGFAKGLDLAGVGYRAAKQGNKLVLTVGYSQPVEMVPDEGLEVEVPAANKIIVRGIDKELVGAFAAKVRAVRPPEPYKGKGIKYENEVVRRKVGKSGIKK